MRNFLSYVFSVLFACLFFAAALVFGGCGYEDHGHDCYVMAGKRAALAVWAETYPDRPVSAHNQDVLLDEEVYFIEDQGECEDLCRYSGPALLGCNAWGQIYICPGSTGKFLADLMVHEALHTVWYFQSDLPLDMGQGHPPAFMSLVARGQELVDVGECL